jgi:hypothetical protein
MLAAGWSASNPAASASEGVAVEYPGTNVATVRTAIAVGFFVGLAVRVSLVVGARDAFVVGVGTSISSAKVGANVGLDVDVGSAVGNLVGGFVGARVGAFVGLLLGGGVGYTVGAAEGDFVGFGVG